MNATLRDRLIQAEQQFLIAVVANDEGALKDFSQEWSQLARHFRAVEASGGLDDSTTLLLSHVSRVIKATANCMLECEAILNDAQNSSTNDPALNLLLDNTHLVSTKSSSCPSFRLLFSSASTSGTPGILGQKKLLDTHAYRWLMQNMHNPYPTATQMQIISDESLASMAQAELWFQEVRDTIGWTRLSNEFYAGSLDATTAAAKRVYLEHDNTIPFDVAFTFAAVKSSMEALFLEYPASLAESVGYEAQTLQSVLPDDDSTHFKDVEETEDEDTTPPPPVAGCKRNFTEDIATSAASDLHRPPKRLRTRLLRQDSPHSGSTHPSSNTFSLKNSAIEALTHTSTIPVTSVQPSDPSFSVGLKPSSEMSPNSTFGEWKQANICGGALETMVISPDAPTLQVEMHGQSTAEGSPPVCSIQSSLSTAPKQHLTQDFVPTFQWPASSSLNHRPSDSFETSHITADPGAHVELSVFDWKSISNPLVETTIPTNQPVSVYVPSSDLAALDFDPLGMMLMTETGYDPLYPLDNLGSLEDFSLPQFPLPTTFPPDLSAPPSASFCVDNSTYPSPDMDWSAITDFIDQFSSFSAESSSAPSPSSTFDAAPSTPENPTASLLPPPPNEVNKPISLLDPSIPPSAFLPAEPGIFTDDASSMWSLLCGLS